MTRRLALLGMMLGCTAATEPLPTCPLGTQRWMYSRTNEAGIVVASRTGCATPEEIGVIMARCLAGDCGL